MAIEKRYERIEGVFTDKVEAVGTVRRVFEYALLVFGNYDTVTGDRLPGDIYEWHYYGTTPAQKPPPSHPEAPVIQNNYIAFPQDFELLGNNSTDLYFEMALRAGLKKEGLT